MHQENTQSAYSRLQRLGLLIGLIGLVAPLVTTAPDGLTAQGWRLIGVVTLMASWWIFSVINIYVTALIPLFAFPLLKISSSKAAAALLALRLYFSFLAASYLRQQSKNGDYINALRSTSQYNVAIKSIKSY